MRYYYYSEVALCFSCDAIERLNLFIESSSPEKRKILTNFISLAQSYHQNGAICFVWKPVKWYDELIPNMTDETDAQIKASKIIKSFFDNIASEDFLWLRMGEFDDDIEKLGSFYNNPFNLSVKREVIIHTEKGISIL